MDLKISQRMAAMQPSAIREIFKNMSDPSIIPFAGGNPSQDAFPVKELENIARIIFENNPTAALQYSVTEGYPQLREAAKQFADRREPGLVKEGDGCVITSGAQQAIQLAAQCLVDERDTVLCENPTFIGALNAFRTCRAKLVGIDMEEDGISIDGLEAAIRDEPRAKLLYLIPNFQNPTGVTMSLEKRQEVYRVCKKAGIVILEDNPYGDLRFAGTHIPAIKTMDTEGIVCYCGTFSKIISPGLRVGYAIGPQQLLDKMVVAKQCSDVHTTILSQIICCQFLQSCNIGSHLSVLKKLYRGKCGLMLQAMRQQMDRAVFTAPEGGFFVWCVLPDRVGLMDFVRAAGEAKVAVVPGTTFLPDTAAPCSAVRLNFSAPSNQQITDGIERLGKVLDRFLR
ncbi:MAG: PLP-dependent aminotransferase family protein [Angelakisella sp.]|jgi:2-aminoadipate transaminase|nr:PLP-dependent aminotransferase family protein [Angelakisella sp.]